MVDVSMLRKAITDLTDKDGYVVLMATKVEELQNQLIRNYCIQPIQVQVKFQN
jgi:hypothetical protein